MKKSMRICGYATSAFKFGDDTLYVTKYDDGRFEYRGFVNIPATVDCAMIPHPFNAAKNVTAIATNAYLYNRNIYVSSTCDTKIVRIDVTMQDGNIPTFKTGINIYVQGFWK